MGWLSSIADGASEAWDATTSAASSAGSFVADTATSAYDGVVGAADTASGYIHRAEDGVTSGMHWMEDAVDHGSHALAGTVADIPVVGTVAEGLADAATFQAQITGGVIGGATTLVGGVANAAVHPLDTARGLETMAEHLPGPAGQALRMGHGLVDMATGDASFGDVMDRSFNPIREQEEDQRYWGAVGNALIDPYKKSWREGRYGEVVGRGAFDIGMLLSGVGEAEGAGAAARASEVANAARVAEVGDVARLGEVADAARVGETADAARVAETADAARATETADAAGQTKLMGESPRNTTPLTPEEIARARSKAVEFGMPEKDISVNTTNPEARTSYGQMYDGAIENMEIANDVKPAQPRQLPDGSWERLSPNQRVSADGAIAHEVVGHRGADLAGQSRIAKDPFAYEGAPDVVTREGGVQRVVENGKVVEKTTEEVSVPAKDFARQTDEAQASLRAAKLAPGLSNAERMTLFKDAMQRLAKIGLGVDDVPGLGLFLE